MLQRELGLGLGGIRVRVRVTIKVRVRVRRVVVTGRHKGVLCVRYRSEEVEELYLGCGWERGCAVC